MPGSSSRDAKSTNGYKIFSARSSNVEYGNISVSSDPHYAANIRHHEQRSRMQAERDYVDVQGHGQAEGSMMYLASADPALTEQREEAYARWISAGAIESFSDFCRNTIEVPISDHKGRATGKVRPVRWKVLQSGAPLDD